MLLGAGCSSSDFRSQSQTAQGAEIGAAVGGIAGAVIGHERERRSDATAARVGDTAYTVQSVPPTPTSQPYEQMPPQPSRDAVWIRGHYEYTGSGYQWVTGRWEVPPAGMHTWVEPTWQPAPNGGYVYTRGHWQ